MRGDSFSGVALIDTRSGSVQQRIDAFDDKRDYQAGGDYDGRHAVWKEYKSPNDLDEYDVKLWDRLTGKVQVVGSAHRTGDGQVIPSTWQDPVTGGGYAAWVEGLDTQGGGEIVLLDLRTGKRVIARRGHPGWVDLTDDLLVWAESAKPGSDTTMHAYSLKTHAPVPVPPALAQVRGGWGFVTDGRAMAWVGGGSNAVFYAASLASEPAEVGQISEGGFSPPLALAGGVVTVPVSAGGLLIADTSTATFTMLPSAALAARAQDMLLLDRSATSKTQQSTSALAELDPHDVNRFAGQCM